MAGPLDNPFVLTAIAAAAVAVVFLMRRRAPEAKLQPESQFEVAADANGFQVVDPSGRKLRTSWSDIDRLLIRTTDEGPLLPDVFWEIHPLGKPPIVFPGGATGETEFLEAAQTHLRGFHNDQVIAAMSSTANREFVVWEQDRN